MAIPTYEGIMLPLLHFASDGQEHSGRDAVDHLAQVFSLSEQEKNELLPSGQQGIFYNRVGWARAYLQKAGLLESPRRSIFRITERGLALLKENPKEVRANTLKRYDGFREFLTARREKTEDYEPQPEETSDQTPEEALQYGYQRIRQTLEQEVLSHVRASSSAFFERLVVELLVKMGYGGSIKDAGRAIGKSGDEGIDGIIKEDRLGLDVIYVQAKRWDTNSVGRPEIQKFVGALVGQRAKKGVFITTSTFSKEAIEYVTKVDNKVVLIDGQELAQLMIDFDLGVSKLASYDIKRIDSDFFSDE